MKKTTIKYLILSSLLVIFIVLCIGIKSKIEYKKTITSYIQTLPQFCMKEITGTQFCSNNIPVETPVLLMYFHPECDICSNEIKQFIEYKDSFYKINILLITNAQQDKSIKFYAAHSLFEIMNLKLLLDEDNMFQTYFGTSLVPSSFLYNNKHELVKTFQGEVKAETLINYLNQ